MPKKRQRLQLDERREQLLDIGLELFTDGSYESVSIATRRLLIARPMMSAYDHVITST